MNVFPKTQTANLQIRITPDLKNELERRAKEAQVTPTEMVRRSLRTHFLFLDSQRKRR